MSNTITAFFNGRVGVCESLYQYDYGIVMVLDGIMFDTVFDAYFSTTGEEDAIPVIGKYNRVAIPDSCLQRPGTVTLHIPFHEGQNDSEVEYIVTFRVIGRARPEYDGTSEESTAIAKALAVLQDIQGDVSTWLDNHPEATTTVLDGSLTEAKFTNELQLKTLKDYVTPEMFGAKGDGVTDDTTAIQNAIDSGKTVIFNSGKTYAFAEPIFIDRNNSIIYRLINNGELLYTGSDFGFYITSCEYNKFEFGRMRSPNGNCVKVRNNTTQHTVYLDFYFKTMSANANSGACFTFDINNSDYKYINDIRFYNGKFATCANAVKFVRDSRSSVEYGAYRFNNTAFEGCTYVVNLCKDVSKLYFNSCRLLESVTKFFTYDENYVADNTHASAIWSGADLTLTYLENCSNVIVEIASGGYTKGRGYFGKGVFYNNILYLSNDNSDYAFDITSSVNIETAMSGCDRRSLARIFRTPTASGVAKDVVLSSKIFLIQPNGSDSSDLFPYKEHPFNKIIVVARTYSSGGTQGTINFVDSNGNVIYSVTGSADQFIEISYSAYNQRYTFKKLNQEFVSYAS